jgi:tRNA (pseudouridine54-N1)-methyltransferase
LLLLAHRVPVDGQFTLNDLAGGGGRMDEVARVVSAAFTVSNGVRQNVELTILFESRPPPDARRVVVRGDRVRYLNPDERSTAALLKNALTRSVRVAQDVEASPGFTVGPVDPLEELARFARSDDVVWLTERGELLRSFRPELTAMGAILSDDQDPTAAEVTTIRAARVPEVSLGPRSIRASQCVDVFQNELDLRESRPTHDADTPPGAHTKGADR